MRAHRHADAHTHTCTHASDTHIHVVTLTGSLAHRPCNVLTCSLMHN